MGHGGLVVLVDLEVAAGTGAEAGPVEGQAPGGAQAPGGEEHAFGRQVLASAQVEDDVGSVEPHLVDVDVDADAYPEQLDLEPQPVGDLAVQERKQAVLAAHDRHLHAEGAEHRRVLAADDAAAHDRHRARNAAHVQDGVAVVQPRRIAGDTLRPVRT